MNDIVNVKQAAEFLGVSNATIRNWIRHNFLTPSDMSEKQFFDFSELKSLKEKIINGELERLNKRANKRNSRKKFVPKEYITNHLFQKDFSEKTGYILENSLEIYNVIFYLSLNIFYKEGLLLTNNIETLLKFELSVYKNSYLRDIFHDFFLKIPKFSNSIEYTRLLEFELPSYQDILGLFYQSVKSEGDKAKQGSYYTPKYIVNDIVSEYVKENSVVLDPCCGTGQFLLNICEKTKNPNNIYGFDIDPLAVFISKLNLILKYKSLNFNPNIYQLNTLIDFDSLSFFNFEGIPQSFDVIITNPPWGLHFKKETIKSLNKYYPQINSQESFSYFLVKSIELLKSNGIISFILPESVLNIKVHSDLRKIILEKTTLLKFVKLGRAFTNVFTNVVRMDLQKGNNNSLKTKIDCDQPYTINQKRFWNNSDYIFDINVNEKDNIIIQKVYNSNYDTLKNNAIWALGIVTGDNKKFIHSSKGNHLEEIYKGKDVDKFFLSKAKNFIHFEPEKFQQVASIEKYRAEEKLIYKFISNKLVFAYDDQQKLTLNSANILIPKIYNYPIKVVLALLNSSLYQFIYTKKFSTIKVLRGNLEELPFPVFDKKTLDRIVWFVDQILYQNIEISELDSYIMNIFNITDEEQDYISRLL